MNRLIQIFIKFNSKTKILSINNNDILHQLKLEINKEIKIKPKYQILYHQGKILDNETKTLNHYNINNNSEIDVHIGVLGGSDFPDTSFANWITIISSFIHLVGISTGYPLLYSLVNMGTINESKTSNWFMNFLKKNGNNRLQYLRNKYSGKETFISSFNIMTFLFLTVYIYFITMINLSIFVFIGKYREDCKLMSISVITSLLQTALIGVCAFVLLFIGVYITLKIFGKNKLHPVLYNIFNDIIFDHSVILFILLMVITSIIYIPMLSYYSRNILKEDGQIPGLPFLKMIYYPIYPVILYIAYFFIIYYLVKNKKGSFNNNIYMFMFAILSMILYYGLFYSTYYSNVGGLYYDCFSETN